MEEHEKWGGALAKLDQVRAGSTKVHDDKTALEPTSVKQCFLLSLFCLNFHFADYAPGTSHVSGL